MSISADLVHPRPEEITCGQATYLSRRITPLRCRVPEGRIGKESEREIKIIRNPSRRQNTDLHQIRNDKCRVQVCLFAIWSSNTRAKSQFQSDYGEDSLTYHNLDVPSNEPRSGPSPSVLSWLKMPWQIWARAAATTVIVGR